MRLVNRPLYAEAGTAISSCEIRDTADVCLKHVIRSCTTVQVRFRHSMPKGLDSDPFREKDGTRWRWRSAHFAADVKATGIGPASGLPRRGCRVSSAGSTSMRVSISESTLLFLCWDPTGFKREAHKWDMSLPASAPPDLGCLKLCDILTDGREICLGETCGVLGRNVRTVARLGNLGGAVQGLRVGSPKCLWPIRRAPSTSPAGGSRSRSILRPQSDSPVRSTHHRYSHVTARKPEIVSFSCRPQDDSGLTSTVRPSCRQWRRLA